MLKGPKDNEYVIRNINKEERIEETLNALAFYRNNDKFIFNGSDEKLFELLSEDLTDLKEKATISSMTNMVFAGCTVTTGRGMAIVCSTGINTEVAATKALIVVIPKDGIQSMMMYPY